MESWEFLLQKKGTRSWLPIKRRRLKIEAGQYRIVAQSCRANVDVEIKVIYQTLDEVPPKRRAQKRLCRTSPEGLMMVIPFTKLRPGYWEFRCTCEQMDEILGEFWQELVQLHITPPQIPKKPKNQTPQGENAGQNASQTVEQPVSSPLSSPAFSLYPASQPVLSLSESEEKLKQELQHEAQQDQAPETHLQPLEETQETPEDIQETSAEETQPTNSEIKPVSSSPIASFSPSFFPPIQPFQPSQPNFNPSPQEQFSPDPAPPLFASQEQFNSGSEADFSEQYSDPQEQFISESEADFSEQYSESQEQFTSESEADFSEQYSESQEPYSLESDFTQNSSIFDENIAYEQPPLEEYPEPSEFEETDYDWNEETAHSLLEQSILSLEDILEQVNEPIPPEPTDSTSDSDSFFEEYISSINRAKDDLSYQTVETSSAPIQEPENIPSPQTVGEPSSVLQNPETSPSPEQPIYTVPQAENEPSAPPEETPANSVSEPEVIATYPLGNDPSSFFTPIEQLTPYPIIETLSPAVIDPEPLSSSTQIEESASFLTQNSPSYQTIETSSFSVIESENIVPPATDEKTEQQPHPEAEKVFPTPTVEETEQDNFSEAEIPQEQIVLEKTNEEIVSQEEHTATPPKTTKTDLSVSQPKLTINLLQDTFIRRNNEPILISGNITTVDAKSTSILSKGFAGGIHYKLWDPQQSNPLFQVEQPLSDATIPLVFNYLLDIPTHYPTRLLLGEVRLEVIFPQSTGEEKRVNLATQTFSITAGVDELLDVVQKSAFSTTDTQEQKIVEKLENTHPKSKINTDFLALSKSHDVSQPLPTYEPKDSPALPPKLFSAKTKPTKRLKLPNFSPPVPKSEQGIPVVSFPSAEELGLAEDIQNSSTETSSPDSATNEQVQEKIQETPPISDEWMGDKVVTKEPENPTQVQAENLADFLTSVPPAETQDQNQDYQDHQDQWTDDKVIAQDIEQDNLEENMTSEIFPTVEENDQENINLGDPVDLDLQGLQLGGETEDEETVILPDSPKTYFEEELPDLPPIENPQVENPQETPQVAEAFQSLQLQDRFWRQMNALTDESVKEDFVQEVQDELSQDEALEKEVNPSDSLDSGQEDFVQEVQDELSQDELLEEDATQSDELLVNEETPDIISEVASSTFQEEFMQESYGELDPETSEQMRYWRNQEIVVDDEEEFEEQPKGFSVQKHDTSGLPYPSHVKSPLEGESVPLPLLRESEEDFSFPTGGGQLSKHHWRGEVPPTREEITVPTPMLDVIEGELAAGDLVLVKVRLPVYPGPIYVKLWVLDLETRQLLDGPRAFVDFDRNSQGELETLTQLIVPMGSLTIRFEAIAIDVETQRESHKAICDRNVVPPNFHPKTSYETIDFGF